MDKTTTQTETETLGREEEEKEETSEAQKRSLVGKVQSTFGETNCVGKERR